LNAGVLLPEHARRLPRCGRKRKVRNENTKRKVDDVMKIHEPKADRSTKLFGDIYLSNPPLGKKKNDIIFTTGLNISFIHGGVGK
jgi:hypothetical protein